MLLRFGSTSAHVFLRGLLSYTDLRVLSGKEENKVEPLWVPGLEVR